MGRAHATGFYSPATVFAIGRILESDISNSGFSETIDASNVFVGYKYPTYIWIPACAGMTAEISARIAPSVFR